MKTQYTTIEVSCYDNNKSKPFSEQDLIVSVQQHNTALQTLLFLKGRYDGSFSQVVIKKTSVFDHTSCHTSCKVEDLIEQSKKDYEDLIANFVQSAVAEQ